MSIKYHLKYLPRLKYISAYQDAYATNYELRRAGVFINIGKATMI